jgi:predicted AAA+ superfamily ATPase
MNKTIRRDQYLNKIEPYIGKQIIKVYIGQRRVGKSVLLRQTADLVKKQNGLVNIIYINKELYEFKEIKSSDDLFQYVNNRMKPSHPNCVFVDEIQEITEFEVAIRQLFALGVDLYITGSNAKMLSGDLATHLSGRYIEFYISSLSYPEFLEFHQMENSTETLNKYFRFGGLPYLIHLPLEEEVIYGYLKSIFNTIVLKDIVARYNIRDIDFLERMIEYLSDNLGSYISAKKISDFLKSQKIRLSINTTLNYLRYLSDSFFIHRVQRLDIIGKKRFEINDKFFFSDLGLKHAVIPYSGNQIANILENLVYNHLVYLDFQVFVGKHQDREIDFVAQKGNIIKYIQVCYQLSSEDVFEREFGNLMRIKDNYEKIVVSADQFATDYKGIKHIYINDFLVSYF